jgi:preprotein translocase subunit YajC
MNFLISTANAQAAGGSAGAGSTDLILGCLSFYVLIRPQQKRMKDQ